jgi:hypothetical protein
VPVVHLLRCRGETTGGLEVDLAPGQGSDDGLVGQQISISRRLLVTLLEPGLQRT